MIQKVRCLEVERLEDVEALGLRNLNGTVAGQPHTGTWACTAREHPESATAASSASVGLAAEGEAFGPRVALAAESDRRSAQSVAVVEPAGLAGLAGLEVAAVAACA